jgi:hypothetical protein
MRDAPIDFPLLKLRTTNKLVNARDFKDTPIDYKEK